MRDLLDASQLQVVFPKIEIINNAPGSDLADFVIVNLEEFSDLIGEVRRLVPHAFIVGYGPHGETEEAKKAAQAGADRVLPRSRFFRDQLSALARTT